MKGKSGNIIKKEEITGNELDLSMNQLTAVPVHELAELTKVTHLDLSSNHLEILPDNFCTLVHLVKLDLSKNVISKLPYDFGNLTRLQHLDLYGNKIIILPVSFCQLKSLKWLDLSRNPLDPKLSSAAGDCLDAKQCQTCAKNVVCFMQDVQSEIERKRQKALKAEREREAALKAEEERIQTEQRKLKKAERERKKAETKANLMRKKEMEEEEKLKQSYQKTDIRSDNHAYVTEKLKPKRGFCWKMCSIFFMITVVTFFVSVGFRIFEGHTIESFDDVVSALKESKLECEELIQVWWSSFAMPYLTSWKQSLGFQ